MMTNRSDCSEIAHIGVPLTRADRQLAQIMADCQPDSTIAQLVYANTLAVQALHTYLTWMEVRLDLTASHSQNQPQPQVADLYLPELGQRLECCVVQGQHCQISPRRQRGRLGYVAVQLDSSGHEATLVGFLTAAQLRSVAWVEDWVAVGQFSPLDTLLDCLAPARQRLSDWLQDSIAQLENPWQSVLELVAPVPEFACLPLVNPRPAIGDRDAAVAEVLQALRSVAEDDEETRWGLVERLWSLQPDHPAAGVRRGVDLGLYLDGVAIALVVSTLRKPNGELAVLLRVYPSQQQHLPSGLQLAGRDEAGEAFLVATARERDHYIQLKFSAQPEERFAVQVAYGEGEYVEHFVA
jgi:hypothetical protein